MQENKEEKTEKPDTTSAGLYFPRKDVRFATVRAASIGAVVGTALTYGASKLLDGLLNQRWSLAPNPGGLDMSFSLAAGGLMAALSAGRAHAAAAIYNHKADTINRHADNLALQEEILLRGGGMEYHYRPGKTEKALRLVADATFYGWLFSDIGLLAKEIGGMGQASSLHMNVNDALLATSMLSWGAGLVVGAVRRSQAVGEEQERFSHAEKLAMERLSQSEKSISAKG